ncbi:MAG: hypothetical protein ABID71_06125 [Chloroflexota bacterium]
MAELNKKYFVTGLKQDIAEAPWNPVFTPQEATRLLLMDKDMVPGAFYVECAWFWPGDWPEIKPGDDRVKAHKHDYDEVIAFFGTNRDDPYDLGGEVELWIDGQQYLPTRSFLAFIPAGTEHCPLNIRRVDTPIFHFTAGTGKQYF